MHERVAMRNSWFLPYLKRLIRTAFGRDHLLVPDRNVPNEYIGSEYGGWVVAVEPLKKAQKPVVLSFGLGDDISFDEGIIRKYGAAVYGFDPTDTSLKWIADHGKPSNMQIVPIGLSDYDGKQKFRLPDSDGRGNFSVKAASGRVVELNVMRYSSLLQYLKIQHVDLLKLDIEGSEYSVIPDIVQSAVKPVQFLIEFHHRLHHIPIAETLKAVDTIKAAGYALFDVSPGGRELSFIRV